MNVGLCTISGRDRPLAEVIEIAADVGYDAVEIWGKDHVNGGSETECRTVNGMVTQNGMEVTAFGSYLRAGTDDFADEVDHEVAVADRLGAEMIRVWAGRGSYTDHDPTYFDRVVEDLRTTADRAADRGVEVTVEKHANTLTDTLEGARAVIDAVDHPNCGLNYQPGFSVRADEIDREVDELAGMTNHCHLQAVPARGAGGGDRCPLSEAFYDVEGVLACLQRDGFEGPTMVEFVTDDRPYRDAIAADLQYLRSVL